MATARTRRRARRPERAGAARGPAAGGLPRIPVVAGLCSILLGVPLAVIGFATGPYDDAKAWALPILAGLTTLAWVATHPGGLRWREIAGGRATWWLHGVVVAYAAWWCVTTVISLAPGQSLVGTFARGLGLVTFGSTILLFPLVRSECRSTDIARALIDAALLGSAPVCVLALGQALGWDPLPKPWDPSIASLTVRSTFGHHVFLGSYLAALIPLGAARIEMGLRDREAAARGEGADPRRRWALVAAAAWVIGAVGLVALASVRDIGWWLLVPWGILGAVGWALALAASDTRPLLPLPVVAALVASQVVVLILSQARGAFLGMLAGLGVATLALFARRRAWKTVGSLVAALLAIALFLAMLNLARPSLAPLRAVPLLNRLSAIANVQPGTPGWVRLRLWRGIADGWQRQLKGEVLIPGAAPRLRSVVGFGLETQIITLDPLVLRWLGVHRARFEGGRVRFVADRAHNVVLDHLVTGGLIGVALWAVVIGSILTIGVARARAATAPGDFAVRIGALGAVIAHLVEGQVGIATPMPMALFWIAAALCTMPGCSAGDQREGAPPMRRAWWITAALAMTLVVGLVAWLETRWLLASVAYARGVRAEMAGLRASAYQDFQRSRALMPLLALSTQAVVHTGLRLAATEADPARRLALLHEAEAALDEARRHAWPDAALWTLRAQVAFAAARAGERGKLQVSLDAFREAARLRPGDPEILTQWAWALLDAQDPARARETARSAVAASRGRGAWMAWALLARAARDLGDGAEAEAAASKALSLAPPAGRPILESMGLSPR